MSEKMKKSIRNKLITMTFTVAFIAITLLSIVSWGGFNGIKTSSNTISKTLIEISADNNQAIIKQQALDQLSSLAAATAITVNSRLENIMSQTVILAACMEDLYENPDDYSRIDINPPRIEDTGTYVGQLVYTEDTDVNLVSDEVGLMGNVVSNLLQVSENIPEVSSAHFATESGFLVLGDDKPELKLDLEYLDSSTRSWYINAVESKGTMWTDVFEDSYGRGLAVTCSHPVYDPLGNLKAVLAIGCQLSEISSVITDVSVGETGRAVVVDNYGNIIMGLTIAETESGIVYENSNFYNSNDPVLINAADEMTAGESGIVLANYDNKDVFIAYAPMESIPWSVVTFMDISEVLEPVYLVTQQANELARSAEAEAEKIASSTLVAMFAGMAASAVAALLVGLFYSNRIALPIRSLEQGVREISKGRLDYTLDIKTGDEIENLAAAFNIMTTDLKKHITDLTTVTAEKEKYGAELNVATQIQSSMLPNEFPAFPDLKQFDIYATMLPAKEVGGDFYDFFLVDDSHLGLVMADVSGKGVPAALFMVIAKTLIQNYAQKGESPADVMMHTNNQLCQNNDANMFVTVWFAILNIETGELNYSNAGHNPPLLRHNNGEFEYLVSEPDFVLAGMEDMDYEEYSLTLQKGDILYLYTDGVTEATNSNDELYSDERLLEKINSINTHSLKTLLENIKSDIDLFVGEAPQFDDITMLALRFGEEP